MAVVVSVIITLAGLIALGAIPVAQYPQITPPEITVSAFYPGANAKVVADSVAAPIEEEVNGTDKMLYMSSSCSNNGSYRLSVTFAVGSNPDIDQVNVQNRIQLAIPRLPQEVRNEGIDVRKRSSNMMAVISFFSPHHTRSKLFLSNYVSRHIKDDLVRLPGVSDAQIFGEFRYSMRVWIDPSRLAALGLTASDVARAIRQQNIQAAVGSIGTAPAVPGQQVSFTVRSKGRLDNVEDFKNIIIRSGRGGGTLRLRDVARVELGSRNYATESILNGKTALGMAIYREVGSNALDTMKQVRSELKRLAPHMPKDVAYEVVYDTTDYVRAAIHEIEYTLVLTFLLVLLVNFVFLQDWRATLVPTVTIPVSLIGTFAILLALGYSANTISLFALVMAIGLVVDDAIVVVENVHRIMDEEHLDPKTATIKAMGQVTGPIISTTLVLLAVFIPVGFLPGIAGQLYKQFAVTISTSVVLSAINALTLSPALCALLLKPRVPARRGPLGWFNRALDASRSGYVAGARWLIRRLVVFAVLLLIVWGSAYVLFRARPTSFLPNEDQGAFFINVQLPEDATLARTTTVMHRITQMIRRMPGVRSFLGVSGFSMLSGVAENVGLGIVTLKPWDQRTTANLHLDAVLRRAQAELAAVPSANIFAFAPPPILGLGTVGGFDFRLQALQNQSPQDLARVAMTMMIAANQNPELSRVFTTYRADTPQIFVNLDRTKAQTLHVPVSEVYRTLGANLGSMYVNDFNLYGRVYHVTVQDEARFRSTPDDIRQLYVRSTTGAMVPVGSLATLSTMLGPPVINRYNQFESAQLNGNAAPGYSSGDAMAAMERLAKKMLPSGYGYDWSTMSFQERKASGQSGVLFALALLFVYLFLVAQYESWNMPLAIIFYIPVATLGALIGLWLTGISLSIYAQIGLVLLVGLASKNAILIVEFARDQQETGLPTAEAAVEGARIRFRPVLMTAFTFILGVAPMVVATGAGANSRRHIGTAVFSGMLLATVFGIFLVPPLYYVLQSVREKGRTWRTRRRHDDEQ